MHVKVDVVTTPNRPVPPSVDEMWKTFVTTASGKDPLRTITSFELRKARETKALVPETPASPVAIADLPSVPVVTSSTGRSDPVTTDFEVTGVLGEGGMGRVLLARQKSLQRDVALKVLKGEETNREIVDTLLAEAVITGSIEHPSIVPVHALGRDKSGLPVLVMKRIDGISWRRLIENPSHPLWSSLCVDITDRLDVHLEILMSVCNAVHYAHSRGIVHRDIKLDNVMIGGFGEVYLVDWGIAVRVADLKGHAKDEIGLFSPPVGTLAYMAPEMALGDLAHIDARTDVYLLGATLHFLLQGKPRHCGNDPLELLLSARDSEPVDYGPNVPAELAAICNRAMHVDPDARFSSALELRQALTIFRRHRGSLTLSAKAFAEMAEVEAAGHLSEREWRRRMTQCRFAFMLALEAWPGNEPAREGLDKVLERAIEYEIGQRDAESARTLLSELSIARPDLEKKIDDLATEIENEKKRALRFEAIARDADLRVGARFQLMILAVLPICAILAFFVLAATGENERLHMRQLIIFPMCILAALVGMYFKVRKGIVTAIGRRAFLMLLLYPLSLVLHRLFAIARGDTIVNMLMTDMVFSAILSLAFAIAILQHLAGVSVLFLVGAIGISKFPQHASTIFLSAALIAGTLMAGVWTRMIRNEKSGEKN